MVPVLGFGVKLLQGIVDQNNDGWYFVCAHPKNDCGTSAGDPTTSYVTSGWPTKELAAKRGAEHIREHDFGEVMSSLDTFRKQNGITVTSEGKAVL